MSRNHTPCGILPDHNIAYCFSASLSVFCCESTILDALLLVFVIKSTVLRRLFSIFCVSLASTRFHYNSATSKSLPYYLSNQQKHDKSLLNTCIIFFPLQVFGWSNLPKFIMFYRPIWYCLCCALVVL